MIFYLVFGAPASFGVKCFFAHYSPKIFFWTILNQFWGKEPIVGLNFPLIIKVREAFTGIACLKDDVGTRGSQLWEAEFKVRGHNQGNHLFLVFLWMFLPHVVLPEEESWMFRSVAKTFTECLNETQFPKHSKSSILSQFQSDPLEIFFGNNNREHLVGIQQYYRISIILKQTDFSKSCPGLWKSFFWKTMEKRLPTSKIETLFWNISPFFSLVKRSDIDDKVSRTSTKLCLLKN